MKIDNSYGWSTNKPLIASLLEITSPKFIVELGIGMHSTPLFINSGCEDIIFIDSDKGWLDYIRLNNVFGPRHQTLFHDLGPTKLKGVFLKHLTTDQRLGIVSYYEDLSEIVADNSGFPKMLFVDNVTCCRTLAINTLYKEFDIIIYHDCEPKGILWYEYYFNKELIHNFDNYILKTPKTWTGCFINPKLNIEEELQANIKHHVLTYSKEVNIDSNKIYLEKQNNYE